MFLLFVTLLLCLLYHRFLLHSQLILHHLFRFIVPETRHNHHHVTPLKCQLLCFLRLWHLSLTFPLPSEKVCVLSIIPLSIILLWVIIDCHYLLYMSFLFFFCDPSKNCSWSFNPFWLASGHDRWTKCSS